LSAIGDAKCPTQISSANTSPPTNTKVTDTEFFTIEENKTKELEIHFDAAPKELA
jgi:hypothetical protein